MEPVSPAVGLLGDVMLGRMVGQALDGRPAASLWSRELRELMGRLDLLVCNLECCLSEGGTRTNLIPGKPFFFRGPPAAVEALEAVGVGIAGLANNHLLDYGETAAEDTVGLLSAHGIATAGAGRGRDEARRGAWRPAGDLTVGVVAAADHPRAYAATTGRFGIAWAELQAATPRWLLDTVAGVAERCDSTIVFLHWGPNMAVRPAPWQTRVAGELQAAGADLVAGHSAHVFHGVGWGGRGPVLYDLGDALDDYAVDPLLRNDLGVLAIWRPGAGDDAPDELELVGLKLDYCHTGLASGPDADWIARRLEAACGELGTTVERLGERRFRVARGEP